MIGKKLFHYEIVEKIGAGGMGEVYRAKDTKLDKSVAVKILPIAFSQDSERVARFKREAKLLASLNHPHIPNVQDLAQIDSQHFIVMEIVEGDDLSTRISQGPMRVTEALRIAGQIADALAAAHEQGIVHRDLKPANVKLTADDEVKVLDFGLAKALGSDASDPDLSKSPTITGIGATTEGVILGTAAYMSPEQARGRASDKRTDIWAFGCVLFEMLTGQQVFRGETVSDTIAKILEREPNWGALPDETPPRVRRLLERCLTKDPKKRLRDIGDARFDLEDTDHKTIGTERGGSRRGLLPIGIIAGFVIGAALTWFWLSGNGQEVAEVTEATRLTINLPPGVRLFGNRATIAISPDGRRVAMGVMKDDVPQIYVREMHEAEARPLAGTDNGGRPFFSPDGDWVSFYQGPPISLKKIPFKGGQAVTLCETQTVFSQVAWSGDEFIILSPTLTSGLQRVSSSGGELEKLTEPDSLRAEFGHWHPYLLPGGKYLLFTAWKSRIDDSSIELMSLDTGKRETLIDGGARSFYASSGHIVYTGINGLMVVPFDLAKRQVTGRPVPIDLAVSLSPTDGDTGASMSKNGTLIYADPVNIDRNLIWVDLDRNMEPVVPEKRNYISPAISPDGKRIAVVLDEKGKRDISILELSRGVLTPLTFDGTNASPQWTKDGSRILFTSMRRGPFELYQVPADGSASEELLFESSNDVGLGSWSPDGRTLFFTVSDPVTGSDIMKLASESTSEAIPVIKTRFNEDAPAVSPDGEWLAYGSDLTGDVEIYVQSLKQGGGRHRISLRGGYFPEWSPDGKTLYFAKDSDLYVVDVSTESGFVAGNPRILLKGDALGGVVTGGTMHPDGKRFAVVVREEQTGQESVNVILNWFEELERLAPTGQ